LSSAGHGAFLNTHCRFTGVCLARPVSTL
jgi:hypothetical protein